MKERESTLKRDHYVRRFQASRTTKDTWRELNSVLGRSKSAPVVKRLLREDRRSVSSEPFEIANVMNEYFTGIGERLAQQVRSDSLETIENLPALSHRSVKSMFLTPVTPDEVYQFLSGLDVNKSSGYDLLSNKLLRNCRYSVTYFLYNCMNESFSQGVYPNCLKIGIRPNNF